MYVSHCVYVCVCAGAVQWTHEFLYIQSWYIDIVTLSLTSLDTSKSKMKEEKNNKKIKHTNTCTHPPLIRSLSHTQTHSYTIHSVLSVRCGTLCVREWFCDKCWCNFSNSFINFFLFQFIRAVEYPPLDCTLWTYLLTTSVRQYWIIICCRCQSLTSSKL